MNQEAKRIGMANTGFVNSTGMPAEGHYSTAKIWRHWHSILFMTVQKNIIQFILKKNLPTMVSNKVTVMPCYIQIQSVDGLKTGHTNEAGYCVTTSAKRGPMRLITVILVHLR